MPEEPERAERLKDDGIHRPDPAQAEERLRAFQQANANPLAGKQNNDSQKATPPVDNPSTTTGSVGDIKATNVDVTQVGQQIFVFLQKASGGNTDISKLLQDIGYGQIGATTTPDINLTDSAAELNKDIKLPETDEEIWDWLSHKLNEWEVCFVQAAAVLHGSPVLEIKDAALTLYHPVYQENTTGNGRSAEFTRVVDKDHLARTFTQILWVSGAERLFWYDANTNGLSNFAVRVLKVVVRMSMFSAHPRGKYDFLARLEEWATTLSGESAWRARRALGSIWIKLNEEYFCELAHEWAKSDEHWQRAATMLDGAYEREYAELGEQANLEQKSLVLALLAKWIREAHASFQANIGMAIAQAYGRIGQRSLQPALRGLEVLTLYPLRHKNDKDVGIPRGVFFTIVWSYVTLARFGHARAMLKYMAEICEHYCRDRHSPQGRERTEYLGQCRLMLGTIFQAFFLLSSISLSGQQGSKKNQEARYKRSDALPEHPSVPAEQQDILLAGILSDNEEEWRNHIMTILCAAMLENRARSAETAFYLLRIWAEAVLAEPVSVRATLREQYRQFMVELWKRGCVWRRQQLQAHEIEYIDDFSIRYKNTLEQWRVESFYAPQPLPLGAFARDVGSCLKA